MKIEKAWKDRYFAGVDWVDEKRKENKLRFKILLWCYKLRGIEIIKEKN